MRITSKGQVTIPLEIREKAGLLPNTEVGFVLDRSGTVCIVKGAMTKKASRGELLLRNLRAAPAATMSTDALMALTRGGKR